MGRRLRLFQQNKEEQEALLLAKMTPNEKANYMKEKAAREAS